MRAELTDRGAVAEALRGVDAVVHTAALLPTTHPDEAALRRANVDVTAVLARLARDAGVTRFVHLSTGGVYGRMPPGATAEDHPAQPDSAYGRTKLEAERALAGEFAGSGVAWTILRPPGLYAGDRPETVALFRDIGTRALWLHGPTRRFVQPTYIDDVVGVILAVLDRDDCAGEVFNVAAAEAVEFQELIRMIGARLGRGPIQISAPRLRTLDGRLSIAKARARLGFEPTTLADGLDATIAAMRSTGRL